jgi:hypothetical protein
MMTKNNIVDMYLTKSEKKVLFFNEVMSITLSIKLDFPTPLFPVTKYTPVLLEVLIIKLLNLLINSFLPKKNDLGIFEVDVEWQKV